MGRDMEGGAGERWDRSRMIGIGAPGLKVKSQPKVPRVTSRDSMGQWVIPWLGMAWRQGFSGSKLTHFKNVMCQTLGRTLQIFTCLILRINFS